MGPHEHKLSQFLNPIKNVTTVSTSQARYIQPWPNIYRYIYLGKTILERPIDPTKTGEYNGKNTTVTKVDM